VLIEASELTPRATAGDSAGMSSIRRYTGGCLCGALRYEADAEPLYAGLCYCTDCRKASGSGFIPFMGFAGATLHITIYAGSLDDPTCFQPKVAIFARSRACWAAVPPGLTVFDELPPAR
jgi:hypothetical protein